ncbi:MAG: sterol desaturase family protein [Leptolyngbya sp. SIO3F4]|nr:sterol desaturase family protein [Leptolyngbya sp. SIO3F4]
MLPYHIIFPVVPILLLIVLFEAILIQRSREFRLSWRESLASLGVAVGYGLSRSIFGVVPIGIASFIWDHRLWTIPLDRGWTIILTFISLEFCYYWFHRLTHQVPWLWATHAVHHSTTHFNLSATYRLGWTGWLSGNFLFFMPLFWLGFHPVAIATTLGINLLYQFWIHTELIPKLGWLEWAFNTPSHHRVHHAANPEYINRNYGGVLIIFDRLFGTFAAERSNRPPVYGLTHPIHSHNPIKIALHEWARLLQGLKVAKTWRDYCQVIIGHSI